MKKLEINRLEAQTELICANKEDAFKEYCLEKLKDCGFDLNRSIEYTDEIHTITFTQEDI